VELEHVIGNELNHHYSCASHTEKKKKHQLKFGQKKREMCSAVCHQRARRQAINSESTPKPLLFSLIFFSSLLGSLHVTGFKRPMLSEL